MFMFYKVLVFMLKFSSLFLCSNDSFVSHSHGLCNSDVECNIIVKKKNKVSILKNNNITHKSHENVFPKTSSILYE